MATITGTPNNDTLTGTNNNDSINGIAGNDVLFGQLGNDNISGGKGRDWLDGSTGNDTLLGDPFILNDEYVPNSTNGNLDDLIRFYREGSDTLFGGSGNDLLQGGAGKDTLIGGEGNDVLWGGYQGVESIGNEKYWQGIVDPDFKFRDEYFNNGYGDDLLVGGSGNDTLRGDSIWSDNHVDRANLYGNDTLDGGWGDDFLEGGGGLDHLYGGSGNDIIYAGYEEFIKYQDSFPDKDTLIGGSGDDSLVGSYDDNLIDGGVGNDTLIGDNYYYSQSEDTLIGGFGDDILKGGNGNDVLDGGAGNDVLIGDIGYDFSYIGLADTLTGGAGKDEFILGTAERGLVYGLTDYSANDYGIITDFNTSQDIIQLANFDYFTLEPVQYVLGSSPIGSPQGIGIYIDQETDVLVAVVQGVSNLSLEGSYFRFVAFSFEE